MAVKSVFQRTSTRKSNQIKCNFQLMNDKDLELIISKTNKRLYQDKIKLSNHLKNKELPITYDELLSTLKNINKKSIIELNKDLETSNIKILLKGNKKVIIEHEKKFYMNVFIVYSLTTNSIVTAWVGYDKRNYANNFVKIDIRKLLKNV